MRRVNRDFESGRKDEAARRRNIADAAARGAAYEREYCAEERRVLLDVAEVRFYLVEDYSAEELAEWRSASSAIQDSRGVEGRSCRATWPQRSDFSGARWSAS